MLVSCGDKPSHDQYLKLDKRKLEKSIDNYKVDLYKFVKTSIRASVASSDDPELKNLQDDLQQFVEKISSNQGELSTSDYLTIYRLYKKLDQFTAETDEDEYPTFIDFFATLNNETKAHTLLSGKEKQRTQQIEHAVLSAVVTASSSVGKEIALYECSKINADQLEDSEIKILTRLYCSILFYQQGLKYLAEDGLNKNIELLESQPEMPMLLTALLLNKDSINPKQASLTIHSLNYLFRGLVRLKLWSKEDHLRGLEELEVFLSDSKKMGANNELVWVTGSYVFLEKNETEKAIPYLEKLSKSPLVANDEKKQLVASMQYLKKRDKNSKWNRVNDKVFMGKIATRYVFSIVKKQDWETILKEQGVPHTNEMFRLIQNTEDLLKGINKYDMTDLKEKSKKGIKGGAKLLRSLKKSL